MPLKNLRPGALRMRSVRAIPTSRAAILCGLLAACAGVATAGDCGCRPFSDAGQAARIGWAADWIVQLPFDSSNFQVAHVATAEDLVVVQTTDGGVHAIVAADGPARGTVAWSRRVGTPDGPLHPASIGASAVTVATDRTIHAFRKADGATLLADRVSRLVEAGPVEADGTMHVPLRGGTILRISGDPGSDPERPMELSGGGNVSTSPLSLGKGAVGWITDAGTLVAVQPFAETWQRDEIALPSPAVGRPIVRGDDLFVATTSGDLLCLTIRRTAPVGLRPRWRLPLPAPPDGPLVLDGTTLFVSLGVDGVAAVDVATGTLRWHASSPALRFGPDSRIVAAGAGRLWCVDAIGRLLLLDATDGSKIGCLPLCGFSFPVTSTVPGRLVLASPEGLVMAVSAADGP